MSHLRAIPGTGDEPPRQPSRSGTATTVRVEAPGKVNLFLSCGAPGADGYHPLTTVFQAVRLIETVTARRQARDAHGAITLTLEEGPAVPTDERNLAVRAARLLAEATGVTEGVDLLLRKRVPVAGGMAGGSADAAAALLACNTLWGTGLEATELIELAARLGADVPFPLVGATALGQGRGDRLSPLMTRGTYQWVFALQNRGKIMDIGVLANLNIPMGEESDTPVIEARYSFFSSDVKGSGLYLKRFCHAPSAKTSIYSSPR